MPDQMTHHHGKGAEELSGYRCGIPLIGVRKMALLKAVRQLLQTKGKAAWDVIKPRGRIPLPK